ncbi:hypothetical protein JFY64_02485 [Porphyromonas gingivalis]|uniref:DUF6879 family protein n=1 Tax=Porphyromonas TaxID=836 RepID=UPI000B4E1790|nr:MULTISPECIES: DUF6879 family protein [Porphyromonas]MCE8191002.1 hypothetical protein [Porphyromonas gingivalis]MDP0531937.1 hypothetical protein [Porphyromonas gingivalis]MDP0625368.1 hypothetical protein [Porphyromonas gingivalis]OWR77951.1 hypothetical protein SJDPG4_06260 [Porphyromonas gingivalis SJD4]WKD51762.1 hypothetical protein NF669_05630 [Porphyromonas gingivalis]
MTKDFSSTSEIIKGYSYIASPDLFFENFQKAWKNLRSTVLKLETRQVYSEEGNESYRTLMTKGIEKAIELIPSSRSSDIELYTKLRKENIDFIRCRPIQLPLSKYLAWELECYVFNASHGEKIYCLDYGTNRDIFIQQAQHDFMVFDNTLAFIHDYDLDGRIQGGWKIDQMRDIICLQEIFYSIKQKSYPLFEYLEFIGYRCKLKLDL